MADTPDEARQAGDRVAIILAVGVSVALNVVTAAMLYVAYAYHTSTGAPVGLSENGVQLLTGWGGGIIGVLGAFVGYSFGKHRNGKQEPPPL